MLNQILAGTIQLDRILASGLHSTIYQCTDLRTGNTYVCKKVCYSQFNQYEEDALNYELIVAHNITHKNIVPCLDIIHDKAQQTYYVIMPFFRFHDIGNQICQRLERSEHFDEIYIWMIIVQSLLVLDHFDNEVVNIYMKTNLANKFVFGDIRPTSLYADLQGNLYINTFRLSKHLLSKNREAMSLKLIPYLSRERLMNHPYDSKADIWSLGCTIYEMCLLHSLFSGNRDDVLDAITRLHRPIKVPHYSEQMETIVNLLLEPVSEKRPSATELLKHPIIIEYRHFYDKQLALRRIALGCKLPQQGSCKICGGNALDCCEIVRNAVLNSTRLSYLDENGKIVYVNTLEEQLAGMARTADRQEVDRIYSLINPDSRKANYFNIKTITKDMMFSQQQASYAWSAVNEEKKESPSLVMNSVRDRYQFNEKANYFPRDRYPESRTCQSAEMAPLKITKLSKSRLNTTKPMVPIAYNCIDQWSYRGIDSVDFRTQYSTPSSHINTTDLDMREVPSLASNTEEPTIKHDNSPSCRVLFGSNQSSVSCHSLPIDEPLIQVKSPSPPHFPHQAFVPLVYANSPTPPRGNAAYIGNAPVVKVSSQYELHQPSAHTLYSPSIIAASLGNVSVQEVSSINQSRPGNYGSKLSEASIKSKSNSNLNIPASVISVMPSKASSLYQDATPVSIAQSVYRDSFLNITSINPDAE